MFRFPRPLPPRPGSLLPQRRVAEAALTPARLACARFLARARRAERATRGASVLARALAAVLGGLALALALDLAVGPPARARALAAVALGSAAALGALAALAAVLFSRASDRWLARRAEDRHAILDGRLSAVATSGPRAREAVEALAPGVARDLRALDPRSVPDRSLVRHALALALAATVLLALVLAAYAELAPARLGRAVALEDEPAPPGSARILAVRPGTTKVRENESLAVEVGVAGEPRGLAVLVRAGGETRRLPLERRGAGRFAVWLPPFADDGTYRIVGAGEPPEFSVALVRAPRVLAVAHRLEPPAYLGEPARDVASGDVEAVEGTRVVVRATTASEPVSGRLRATWTEDGIVESLPLAAAGPRLLEGAFVVRRSGTYRIDYEDASGLAPRPGPTWHVTAEPDLPPRVSVLAPAADREIAYKDSVAVEYEARDDHGLAEVALHLVVHGAKPRKLDLPIGADRRQARGRCVLSPRALGLLPGDSAIYYVVAVDGRRPLANRATSAPFVLAVEDDSKLRESLTGIDARDDEVFRSVESGEEVEGEAAREVEALRRLERILARQPGSPGGEDALRELLPEDVADAVRALEDLEQDEDSVLLPENAGRDQAPAEGKTGEKPEGQGANPNGPRAHGRGSAGGGTREARDGARRTVVTRVAPARELVRLYRELLERRRALLRRVAHDLGEGKLAPDTIARLGPDAARLLEALRRAGEDPGAPGSASSKRAAARAPSAPPRTLRVRPEIPEDTVDPRPRRERSPAPAASLEPSRAPGWDESLPEELRAVVRAYFEP